MVLVLFLNVAYAFECPPDYEQVKYIVHTPQPSFYLYYNEAVSVLEYSLANESNGSVALSDTITYSDGNRNVIVDLEPGILLEEQDFQFAITAQDLFYNEGPQTKCFTIEVDLIDVRLKSPNPRKNPLFTQTVGVSPSSPFAIVIETDRNAICRWSLVNKPYAGMANFEETETFTKSHHLSNFGMITEVDGYRSFYVKCNTTYDVINEEIPALFYIKVDSSKPIIDSVTVDRASSTNLVIGEPPANTKIRVKTNEFARCKFDTSSTSYSSMQLRSANYNGMFDINISSSQISIAANGQYHYNIICENEAGLLSDVTSVDFSSDFKTDETVTVIKPGAVVGTKDVEFELSTNKKAVCEYSDDGFIWKTFESDISSSNIKHTTVKVHLAEGEKSYRARCQFDFGSTKFIDFSFVIDTEPPKMNSITTKNTCKAYEVYAIFNASDDYGVKEYKYKIEKGTGLVKNWTLTSSNSVIYKDNSTTTKKYYFSVIAADNGGNWMEEKDVLRTSTGFSQSDLAASECGDDRSPTGSVNVEAVGDKAKVTLSCLDDKACDPDKFYYSTSAVETSCSANIDYTTAVEMDPDQYFCWIVTDNSGLTDSGSKFITVSDDSDNDGIIDALDECPDTPLGHSVDDDGCSDSQRDSDDDGVDDNSDKCPYTPYGEEVDDDIYSDCYGCTDEQCDELLGEDKEKDSDKDTVADRVDVCPNTQRGEIVDLGSSSDCYGCSEIGRAHV